MEHYTSSEECATHIIGLIEADLVTLGLKKTYYGDPTEFELNNYPSVVVSPAEVAIELAETRYVENRFQVYIWILHASLSPTRRVRTQEDIILANNVKKLLMQHMNLYVSGEQKAFNGMVIAMAPGQTPVSSMETTVSTRMLWQGRGREFIPEQIR